MSLSDFILMFLPVFKKPNMTVFSHMETDLVLKRSIPRVIVWGNYAIYKFSRLSFCFLVQDKNI